VSRIDSLGAELWQKTYGSYAYRSAAASETPGGYVIAGSIYGWYGSGVTKAIAARIDVAGNLRWLKTYDLGYDSFARGIAATVDGGFVIVGGWCQTVLPNRIS